MFFLCAREKLDPHLSISERNKKYPLIAQLKYKKFYILLNVLTFFNFQEKRKTAPRCTALKHGFSMCKRRIESIKILLRYNFFNFFSFFLNSLEKKANITHRFVFQFSRKTKNNPPLHSSNKWSFYVQEENCIRWGVTEI